ncbi:MAG: hypothetical protein VR71_20615 [Roseovarius sp. BRH_c41]|uniref:CpXC domain-containing protein n=1 Tax=Roseovarius sp. BRH_c41 TaxID=1629709 RepID=UPI0005F25B37|nr:CpXC domain-containing protein [Roseovarius sp. BRH_c41]KJS40904.1 MAG: hypothetical protein VR71_20615 [Roseovarius sp. BRH_c41]
MSLFTVEQAPCPNCGTIAEMEIFSSVNGDRRVDLTEAILTGTIQSHTCKKCETAFRVEPSINYLSVGEGLWMMARPLSAMAHWKEEEEAANTAFEDAYGSGAPDAAKEIGELLTVRLSFGWPAFREKVLIAQHGLRDVSVELMKLAILRNRPANPLAPGVELRLVNLHGDQLEMAWIDAISNTPLDLFTAQRSLYDEVDGGEAWAKLAAELSAGSFVDIQRLTIVPKPMEPAR